MQKRWVLTPQPSNEELANLRDFAPTVRPLLYRRNVRSLEDASRYLKPDYHRDLEDPFRFRDMGKATQRIAQALKQGERITIHGDYDADGVTAAAILAPVFHRVGAHVSVYIPHREREGYGLKNATIERLAQEETKLLITVDCGITSKNEIARAKALGIDTIVLDHHLDQADTFPNDACAILHPKLAHEPYPFKELTAGGIAYKLIQGLIATRVLEKSGTLARGWEKWLLDLVAISTVADVAPLVGENRTLVKFGLMVLAKTRNVGLRALMKEAGINANARPLDAVTIGFQIAPRLNAAGRMAHASDAYKLLLTQDPEEACARARTLQRLNGARQRLVDHIFAHACAQVDNAGSDHAAVAIGDGWPAGVMGLVAGKLKDRYARPAFALGVGEDGVAIGSGRSIEALHIVDFLAAIAEGSGCIARYGGHRMACGLTIEGRENLKRFTRQVHTRARAELQGKDLTPTLSLDAEMELGDISLPLAQSLEEFAPFGEGNERPRFLLRGLDIQSVARVGNEDRHLRLQLSRGTSTRGAIYFGAGEQAEELKGSRIDAVGEIRLREWQGEEEVELRIVDIRRAAK